MKPFKLDKEPKITTGFSTPENYFENFPKKMLDQLPKVESGFVKKEIEEVKVIPFWSRNQNWMYAAAAIIIITLSIPIMNLLNTDSEELYSSEIENYLTVHANLSNDEIVEYLTEEDLKSMEIDFNIEKQTLEEILNEEVDIENQLLN